ncbi:MAG: class SAM-dependent methyltransferase [Rhodospirillales bacterium]|nr:class SAM-dependent methyltransferase [Rhodospirillales bacterium]
MTEATVTIDHLGGSGDGVAESPVGRLYVPFTAPGDQARVSRTDKDSGTLLELLTPSALRVEPPCRHFGRCGGCALQHLEAGFTENWKRSRIVTALTRSGLASTTVAETISVAPGTRRRATLAASRIGKRVILGFAERASHRLADLQECWVLRPELVSLIAPLRDRLSVLLNSGETADIALTWTETGIDFVLIRRRPLNLADREALAEFAESIDLARISWRANLTAAAEPVAARRSPRIRLGEYLVALPQGAFLQPSIEGETLLANLVQDAISDIRGQVVDLFSGLGTFTISASKAGAATAFDGDSAAIAALQHAVRGRPIAAIARDLFREPLTVKELNVFAAAVVDPPRAGAQAQARMLADSGIPRVVYVSCNPVSFARDAAILAQGGYRLDEVTPVDQFLWSPHIELVGVFRR